MEPSTIARPGHYRRMSHEFLQEAQAAFRRVRINVAGVPLRRMTKEDARQLRELGNGIVESKPFATHEERIMHAAQFVWFLSDCTKDYDGCGWWTRWRAKWERERLLNHLRARNAELIADLNLYLAQCRPEEVTP